MSKLSTTLDRQVRDTRRFNRFYTRRIGVLDEGLLYSSFTLTEARVLFELANRDAPDASGLARDLDLDPGYLSRLLQGLRRRRLIVSRPVPGDGRRRRLALTEAGTTAFAELDRRSQEEIGAMLRRLRPAERRQLIGAMDTIQRLLGGRNGASAGSGVILRSPEAGDLGRVVQRHGELYRQEYGWDARFEGLVARVVADFAEHFDPARDRAWIAERDGEPVGSVFVVRKTDDTAKLRLLLVEPAARGLGLGRRLVEECI
ncbi:MAG TPA: helix-turn-helix domain-containing GNAT family N-acetyltransferase, partial [Gemmatimonadales bacterium]|nr:helix-turn-helix domain-containing GNAT family N-acetyltransferase [Gemmatimonadales bacterium]